MYYSYYIPSIRYPSARYGAAAQKPQGEVYGPNLDDGPYIDHSKGFIKGVYYETSMVLLIEASGMEHSQDLIYEFPKIRATTHAAAEELKALEQQKLDFAKDVALMSGGVKKVDSKMVKAAIKAVGGMSNKQAEMFQREIESMKQSVGKRNDNNFAWKELVEIAEWIKEMFK